MLRASLSGKAQQRPLEARVPGKIDRGVPIELAALAMEPRDHSLRVPHIPEQLHQANRQHELSRRRTAFTPKPLEVSDGDPCEPCLIGLSDPRKSLLQIGDQ